jgi:hypothetical protein
MNCKWDDSIKVFCIKEYKTLKVGSGYSIKGRVTWNTMMIRKALFMYELSSPSVGDRKGYGLCIEDDMVAAHRDRSWALPYNERVKWYYFTIKEMDEYFITDDENYKIYLRDQKINSIIND